MDKETKKRRLLRCEKCEHVSEYIVCALAGHYCVDVVNCPKTDEKIWTNDEDIAEDVE